MNKKTHLKFIRPECGDWVVVFDQEGNSIYSGHGGDILDAVLDYLDVQTTFIEIPDEEFERLYV